jgi:pentatricopeptide repeat protein
VKPTRTTYAILIKGYVNMGDVSAAHLLLREMKSLGISRNVVVYSTMLTGYANTHDSARANELLQEMIEDGVTPNKFSFSGLLSSYCKAEDVAGAANCLQKIISHFPNSVSTELFNVVISGYIKVVFHWSNLDFSTMLGTLTAS